jgi:hypothetical protein
MDPANYRASKGSVTESPWSVRKTVVYLKSGPQTAAHYIRRVRTEFALDQARLRLRCARALPKQRDWALRPGCGRVGLWERGFAWTCMSRRLAEMALFPGCSWITAHAEVSIRKK